MSDVINVGDNFYIVRLVSKNVGRVRAFDTEDVQDQINRTMRAEQFRQLREREEQKLTKSAIVRGDERAMGFAIDMAMQRYQQWRNNP